MLLVISVCARWTKALNHLLNIPDDGSENSEVALNLAVDVVGAAADDKLTSHLMNYLLGDVDGNPKVSPCSACHPRDEFYSTTLIVI